MEVVGEAARGKDDSSPEALGAYVPTGLYFGPLASRPFRPSILLFLIQFVTFFFMKPEKLKAVVSTNWEG